MKFPQSLHLIEDFKRSDDYILIKSINSIKNSYGILSDNYEDFKNALKEHHEKSNDGGMWEDNYLRWRLQGKLIRLIFNFLSSAASLIDHTRKHNRSLYKPTDDVAIEYQNRVDLHFKNDLLSSFIKDFRNFLSHDKLPIAVSSRRGAGNTATTSFKLRKASLLDGEWKSKAKLYLDQLPEDFEIEALLDEYFDKVRSLHEWYMRSQLQYHKEVFARVVSKKRDLLILATEQRVTSALPYNQTDIDNDEQILRTL